MPKQIWLARMRAVLALLCDEGPPEDVLWSWSEQDDSIATGQHWVGPPLQDWVNSHCRVSWPLSIDVIEAATMIAESRRDGEDWDEKFERP